MDVVAKDVKPVNVAVLVAVMDVVTAQKIVAQLNN
tara:strand:+ start:1375 stop:1479 length:105 start_codon:yes stop_codon:yes gene_type:complete